MEKLSYREFVRYMSNNSEYTMTDCKEMCSVVFTCLADAVNDYGEVEIYNFGKFSRKHKCERNGVNTLGNTVTVPAFYTIGFKASKQIKEKFNSNRD